MRKAKFAALIIGGVSTCLFGGMFGIYATAPVVSSVAPKNDVENIYEVKTEELANIAAVTSISTTAVTTTSRRITTTTTAVTQAVTETTTTVAETTAPKEIISFSASVNAATAAAAYVQPTEAATEAPTEAYTEAPTTYIEPETEAPTEIYIEPVTEAPTEEYTEPTYVEPETEAPAEEVSEDVPAGPAIVLSDSDYIILCNAVAHEAGCYWISEYDKAKVVEVIMNRVNSPFYPNTILGVLTQPWQFSGSETYVYLGTYSCHVSESVKNAVNLYLNDPSAFNHGYYGFYGDGYNNYFY